MFSVHVAHCLCFVWRAIVSVGLGLLLPPVLFVFCVVKEVWLGRLGKALTYPPAGLRADWDERFHWGWEALKGSLLYSIFTSTYPPLLFPCTLTLSLVTTVTCQVDMSDFRAVVMASYSSEDFFTWLERGNRQRSSLPSDTFLFISFF